MPLSADQRDMLCALSDARVEYLVVGAYALGAYTRPRATGDIDFWIRPTPENAARVLRALSAFGAPITDLSEADFTRPDRVVQIGYEPSRVDFLTSIDGVEFEAAWARRREVVLDGLSVALLSPDDLLANKRATGRPRDALDVQALEEALEEALGSLRPDPRPRVTATDDAADATRRPPTRRGDASR